MNAFDDVVSLRIGGCRVDLRLEGFPPAFRARLRRRYGPFVRGDGSAALRLRLVPVPDRRGSPSAVDVRREGPAVRLRRSDFDVRVKARSARGQAVANVYTFDSLLRVLWTVLLSERGGLFHAAGAGVGSRALLFPGRSGAGKSTLARKVKPPARVLSDELVPVRRGRRGWEAFGAPFWGEFRAGRSDPEGRPLQAVVFLRKGRRLAVRRLSTAEAVRRLLETYLCFDEEAPAHLAFVARLAAEVPAFELTSRRDSPFAEIRDAIGSFL